MLQEGGRGSLRELQRFGCAAKPVAPGSPPPRTVPQRHGAHRLDNSILHPHDGADFDFSGVCVSWAVSHARGTAATTAANLPLRSRCSARVLHVDQNSGVQAGPDAGQPGIPKLAISGSPRTTAPPPRT